MPTIDCLEFRTAGPARWVLVKRGEVFSWARDEREATVFAVNEAEAIQEERDRLPLVPSELGAHLPFFVRVCYGGTAPIVVPTAPTGGSGRREVRRPVRGAFPRLAGRRVRLSPSEAFEQAEERGLA